MNALPFEEKFDARKSRRLRGDGFLEDLELLVVGFIAATASRGAVTASAATVGGMSGSGMLLRGRGVLLLDMRNRGMLGHVLLGGMFNGMLLRRVFDRCMLDFGVFDLGMLGLLMPRLAFALGPLALLPLGLRMFSLFALGVFHLGVVIHA